MSSFDEREREFEARFKHDQELVFKIKARRDRLFGLWAARHLGLDGAAAEAYAKEVVGAEFAKNGGGIAKVRNDFAGKGVAINEARLVDELHRLGDEARKQIERA
jgi:hypothetical protein